MILCEGGKELESARLVIREKEGVHGSVCDEDGLWRFVRDYARARRRFRGGEPILELWQGESKVVVVGGVCGVDGGGGGEGKRRGAASADEAECLLGQ